MIDLTLPLAAASVAILISIVAYFAQKWIDLFDEKLQKHPGNIKDVATQISPLQQKQSPQTEGISKTV